MCMFFLLAMCQFAACRATCCLALRGLDAQPTYPPTACPVAGSSLELLDDSGKLVAPIPLAQLSQV